MYNMSACIHLDFASVDDLQYCLRHLHGAANIYTYKRSAIIIPHQYIHFMRNNVRLISLFTCGVPSRYVKLR